MGNYSGMGRRESNFHLPDITEEERIKTPSPKGYRHRKKHRGNKLHDKRRKK
jgi:hypothetical protein